MAGSAMHQGVVRGIPKGAGRRHARHLPLPARSSPQASGCARDPLSGESTDAEVNPTPALYVDEV